MTALVIADDDPLQRKLAVVQLTQAGFEVRAATDGAHALALLREARPEAVISDVVMPGLDGFQLAEQIRADPALAGVPVVLITNSAIEAADRALARRAGARALILRTPDLAEVIATVREITGA